MNSCGADVLNRALDAAIGRQQRRNASPLVVKTHVLTVCFPCCYRSRMLIKWDACAVHTFIV